METQKIVNLLNGSDNENSKFVIILDYSDAYILVTGNITVNVVIIIQK